jgi:peptidoglycan-associated lipoprotein
MKYLTIFIAIFVIASFGCAQKSVQMSPTEQRQADAVQAGKYPPAEESTKVREGGVTEEELAARDKAKGLSSGLPGLDMTGKSLLLDVLFEFDSYTIKTEYYPKLNEIGTLLKSQRNMNIAVEGNCDERGTIEYNLALGQKRAEAVKSYLVKMGVDGTRIKVISYGKEMPVDPGHTEDAWAKNRRAHVKIDQKG